jgi:hypothetical protein
VCTGCMQTQGHDHEGLDLGCIGIPLADIFGYVVGDIGVHLLGKIESISVARSSRIGW